MHFLAPQIVKYPIVTLFQYAVYCRGDNPDTIVGVTMEATVVSASFSVVGLQVFFWSLLKT